MALTQHPLQLCPTTPPGTPCSSQSLSPSDRWKKESSARTVFSASPALSSPLAPSFPFSLLLSVVARVGSCFLCVSLNFHTVIACDPPALVGGRVVLASWDGAGAMLRVHAAVADLSCWARTTLPAIELLPPSAPLPLSCPAPSGPASQAPSLFQPKPSSGGRRRGGQRHKVKSQGACVTPASGC